MAQKVYIADSLNEKLEQLQEFGEFPTKVKASEALASLLSKISLEVVFESKEKVKYETENDYIFLSD